MKIGADIRIVWFIKCIIRFLNENLHKFVVALFYISTGLQKNFIRLAATSLAQKRNVSVVILLSTKL